MTPDEAVQKRKCTFRTVTKEGRIGKINIRQGQHRITRRKYCIFALWTPEGIKITTIDKDGEFWEKEMFPKLKKFYINCVLPEIVDPRHSRSTPI